MKRLILLLIPAAFVGLIWGGVVWALGASWPVVLAVGAMAVLVALFMLALIGGASTK